MILLILLLLFPAVTFSQNDPTGFNQGFIVKNVSDTLYGLIKNRVVIPYHHALKDIR